MRQLTTRLPPVFNTSNGMKNDVLAARMSNTDRGFNNDEEALQCLLDISIPLGRIIPGKE